MEVSYNNNLEDMVALSEHCLAQNAAYKKRRRWNLYGSPLLPFCVFAYVAYSTNKPAGYVFGIVASALTFFGTLRAYRNFPRKAVEKLQREKPQKEVVCRHTVTISPDGLSEYTEGSRHFLTWGALFDVAFTPDYIYVFNTSATAYIIPRRELGDERFQQVADEIRSQQHRSPLKTRSEV